jgi:uncharacterized protein (TIGR03435 family)
MRAIVAVAVAAGVVCGQTAAPKYSFEVAAVKALGEQTDGGKKNTGMPPLVPPDRLHLMYNSVTLVGVLSRAYEVGPGAIEAPDWMGRLRYHIDAKVPDDAPKGHIPEMLQALLAERFDMTVHWDTREQRGLVLAVAGKGSKMHASETNADGRPLHRKSVTSSKAAGKGNLVWRGVTMDEFADGLTIVVGLPVVNRTAITGFYDISLIASVDTIGSSIHDLGLKLDAQKVTIRRLVVDSAQKTPKEN